MRKQVVAVLLLSVLIFIGCGSGGGNGGSQFVFNSDGFPIVSGKYSFYRGEMTNNCDDDIKPPEFMGNYIITQDGEGVTIISSDSDKAIADIEASGWTILDKTTMTGTLSKQGDMIASSSATIEHEALIGTFYVNWGINGKFTPDHFSGKYGFSIFNNLLSSCSYKADLTASRI